MSDGEDTNDGYVHGNGACPGYTIENHMESYIKQKAIIDERI